MLQKWLATFLRFIKNVIYRMMRGAKDMKKIIELKGKEVDLFINRGRRKVSSYRARIENVYTSVFTVKPCSENADAIASY